MLCKARKEIIQFFNDYSSMVSEAKREERFKTLTPKLILE